jgi:hypothetical protein
LTLCQIQKKNVDILAASFFPCRSKFIFPNVSVLYLASAGKHIFVKHHERCIVLGVYEQTGRTELKEIKVGNCRQAIEFLAESIL